MNLSHWIERQADFAGSKTALDCAGVTLSYGEFEQRMRAAARMLRHGLGVKAGDRIAFIGLNSSEFLVLLFAAARLGAMVAPLNWRLAPPEHSYILADADVSVVIAEAQFRQDMDQIRAQHGQRRFVLQGEEDGGRGWLRYDALLADDGGDDGGPAIGYERPFLIVYTSGTTGRPKGAVLRQEALLWNAFNSLHMHDMNSADRVLCVLPLFHVGGLNILTLPALYCGATVFLERRFDPTRTLAAIEQKKPTLTVLVPATLRALIQHPRWRATDFSSLRCITTGSSIVPPKLMSAFHERGVPVIQVYGATETAPIAVYLKAADAAARLGSTGKPALHCEVRIVDNDGIDVKDNQAGEVLVRGPNVMCGYWRNPLASAEALKDGWFYSGDIGHRDDQGFFYIDDRKKDVVISGGENIYPAELELILQECERINDAVVVARPDPQWGEVPVAVIELKSGCEMTEQQVKALFDGHLARYKHPRGVIFVAELPRNAMGKVQKFRVREMLH